MANKKQIHLKTINLDLTPALSNSPQQQLTPFRPKGSFLLTPNFSKNNPSSPSLTVQQKHKNSRLSKKQSLCINKLNQMVINRFTVDKFLIKSSSHRSSQSPYQKFPKRENHYKNSNAFKYYMNSDAAQKHYSQSMSQLQKVKVEFNQKNYPKVQVVRPQTSKARVERVETEPLSTILAKGFQKSKTRASSAFKNSRKKRDKCPTTVQFSPWQTIIDEKEVAEW